MDTARSDFILALAKALPWYLDFLAVWMLNYETRRIEAMLREMCDGIAAFAKAAMRPKLAQSRRKPAAMHLVPDGYAALGAIFSGAAQAKAAKAQMQAAKLQSDLYRAYLNQAAQRHQMYGISNQQFQQRRSGLEDLLGNVFRGY